jgi:hypothetical protein
MRRTWINLVPPIGFAALTVVGGAFLREELAYDADPAGKAEYYADRVIGVGIGANLGGLQALLFLWLAVLVAQRLRNDRDRGLVAFIPVVGAVVCALLLASAATQIAAIADHPPYDPGASEALFQLRQGVLNMFALALGAFLLVTGLVVVRTRGLLPLWAGWSALVIAVPMILLPDRTLPVLATMLWCLAIAAPLTRSATVSERSEPRSVPA